jgi:hypothetical protein
MEKENWIEDVLNSSNGIVKIIPDQMLFNKIQQKIQAKKIISNQLIWFAAASFVILFSLNIKIVFSKSKKAIDTELIASSISKNNQFY